VFIQATIRKKEKWKDTKEDMKKKEIPQKKKDMKKKKRTVTDEI